MSIALNDLNGHNAYAISDKQKQSPIRSIGTVAYRQAYILLKSSPLKLSSFYLLPQHDCIKFGYMLSQIRLFVVYRLPEKFAHRTQPFEIVCFYAILHVSHPLTSVHTEIVTEETPPSVYKRERSSPRLRFWTCRRLYLGNGARYGLGYN